jgi:hypothetical protein
MLSKFKRFNMKSIKEIALLQFLDNHKHLPEQGSKEWLQSRQETIGGSEISTILNINKYQNIKQLIQQKTGLSEFKKSAPLWFGNLFEFILQQYTEKLFNTKIFETGSIPYQKSKYIKYSPDGIAIINKKNLTSIFSETDFQEKIFKYSKFNNLSAHELLILFEFKNPYMRVPTPNEIPLHYINQPRLGMEVINICEASIFIESVFRFCSYSDIINGINNKYNTFYHYDRVRYINTPICYGAFSLYYDKSNTSSHFNNIMSQLIEYFHTNKIEEFDLSGIKNKNLINNIMENIIDYKDIKIIYHDVCINDNMNNSNKFYFNKYNNLNKFRYEIINKKQLIQSNSNYEYLGIMCYKMLDININPVFKENPINNNVLNKIEDVINIIKECNSLDNIEQKKIYLESIKI